MRVVIKYIITYTFCTLPETRQMPNNVVIVVVTISLIYVSYVIIFIYA